MRIGYPCVNLTVDCRGDKRFRLSSYSERRLIETVQNNLDCLTRMLKFNLEHGLLFFRVTSSLVPFASHPVNRFDWQGYFSEKFKEIGNFITGHGVRISMHPDQFTLINTPNIGVLENSLRELNYHYEVLNLLGLDSTAKIQIHIGGVYQDKDDSIKRFIARFNRLDEPIKKRLVIENDDRLYSLRDCLRVCGETGVPVLFDVFHHELNGSGETVRDAMSEVVSTWGPGDGTPMVDYSSQQPGAKAGRHVESINEGLFKEFIGETKEFDFDVMFEIKDKESSAVKAVKILLGDPRLVRGLPGA